MMKKRVFFCFTVFIFIMLCPFMTIAQDEMTGEVSWVGGYVSGIGYGTATPSNNKVIDKLKALRAAKVVAQRDLLENIKGVRISSQTTVENMMLKEDVIKTRVDGTIKGAQVFKQHFEWQGNVPLAMVELRVYMTGSAGGITSKSLVNTLDLSRKYGTSYSPIPPIPQEPSPQKTSVRRDISYDSNKPVTGVVFSLAGQPFERVLLPVVRTETKSKRKITIYSVKSVDPKIIRTYGVVRYADTVEAAKKITHLGDNVMIVPALYVSNDNSIYVGTDAARLIKESIHYDNDYLQEAKVAISSE
jgi:hypothetical protein